jgi:hypothetical protein
MNLVNNVQSAAHPTMPLYASVINNQNTYAITSSNANDDM